jgi:hypothetical protein
MPENLRSSIVHKIDTQLATQPFDLRNALSRRVAEGLSKGLTERSLEQEDISERKTNLAQDWAQKISENDRVFVPPDSQIDPGAAALLCTNEYFDPNELKQQIGTTNGYLCGVGFGNILGLITTFEKGELPKAICAVDVSPSVVLSGRILIEILKQSTDFIDVVNALKDKEELNSIKNSVIAKEPSKRIQEKLNKVDLEKMSYSIRNQMNSMPSTGITQKNDTMPGSRISVLAVIKERFDDFKQLAVEENMAITLASATNPAVINSFAELPEYFYSKNLVYFSNIIDPITERGRNLGPNNSFLNLFKPYERLNHGASTFLDATQKEEYNLRVHKHPPTYQENDFLRASTLNLIPIAN